MKYFGIKTPPNPKLTVSFGRPWHAALVLLMAHERPCVALTLGARRRTKQFLTSNKPSVPYTARLGLPLPQNSGMQL